MANYIVQREEDSRRLAVMLTSLHEQRAGLQARRDEALRTWSRWRMIAAWTQVRVLVPDDAPLALYDLRIRLSTL